MVGLVGVEARVRVRARAGSERRSTSKVTSAVQEMFQRATRVKSQESDLRLARCFQQSDLPMPTGGLSNPIVRMGRSPAHVQAGQAWTDQPRPEKTKGGGVCFFINKKWCDPRNISILSRSCSPHLEHLSIICRPFYLPREFTSILVSAVYIPPQADTSVALSNLHDEISGYVNKHPDAACIIAGDFNKANLKKVLLNFHQHISCPTRGLNTLDHCYTPLNNAYKAHSLPAFGKSDHVVIFLTPEYKQRIAREPPVEREVTRWSPHSEAMLQASLDDVEWDMFRASSSDVSEFTDVAVSFVNTLTEQATETVTIRTFTNQKTVGGQINPWCG